MRVLIIDPERLGLDFAIRCGEAGHDVRWWRKGPKPTKDGFGFSQFKIIDDWKDSMGWARDGLILLTGNAKLMAGMDRYRDLGFKIFGPTARSAKLEIDRGFGLEEAKKIGINVPSYEEFKSLDEAEAFARKSDKCWVFKTIGSNEDKALSYVSSDPADMVGWIQRQKARGLNLKGPCILQEKIDMFAELGVSGWFGPEGFLKDKWQVCWEHKKLMDGEVGPNTGEQGTVCAYEENERLAGEMLKPFENFLLKSGHRGDFAIGAGIDTSGKAWFFEPTVRLGWPCFYIQVASHRGDPAQWMRDLLDGKDTLKVSYDAAIGIVLAQPMYPYENSEPAMVEGNPISGLEDVWPNIHLASVMMGRGPVMEDGRVINAKTYQTSGEYVMIVTALGDTVAKARARVYRTIKSVTFPNMMYRTDIGEKVIKCLDKLRGFGYATEVEGGE